MSKQVFWDKIGSYLDLRVWDLCTVLRQYTSAKAYEDLEYICALLYEVCGPSDLDLMDEEQSCQELPDVEKITVYQVVKALTEDNYSYRDFSPQEAKLFELLIYYPMTMELHSSGKE